MKNIFYLLFLSITLTACGNQMEVISEESIGKVCDSCIEEETPNESILDENDLQGTISKGLFKNHQAIRIDVANKEVVLSIPLPIPYLVSLPAKPIPELPGAYYQLGQSASGTYQIEVHIPFSYFLPNASGTYADKLPNGDPLPAIPGGELPRYGIKISESNRDIFIYIGPSILAVYATTPEFNPYLPLQFPIKNANKTKIIGYLALVPEKRSYDGGVYLASKLPDGFARFLDEILP